LRFQSFSTLFKENKQFSLSLVVLTGLALSVALLFYFFPKNPTAQTGSAPLAVATVALSEQGVKPPLPVRLKIPAIGVDAAVEYVGLTSDGAVGVPNNPADAAWFNLGPSPGENGSAVIVGHYGGKKASVFDNLYKLRKGDRLYIEDEFGTTTTFVVRETRRYDPEADASYVFGSSDEKSHLNLITCEGDWDKVSKSYSERLVVFTDKE